MYFKVNLKKLDNYSQTITDQLTNDFFQNNSKITGQQILNFTSSDQINLFIIYHIFESWKQSTDKLKSPYFDFENDQVKESYNRFINILSQNISLDKELFRPLVRKAIYETLYWIVAPEELINYQYLNNKLSTVEKVKAFGKYIRINKILIEELIAILVKQQKEKFPQDELVWHFTKIFEANQIAIHDPLNLLQEFSTALNFDVTDLIPGMHNKIPISDVLVSSSSGNLTEDVPQALENTPAIPSKRNEIVSEIKTLPNEEVDKVIEESSVTSITSVKPQKEVQEYSILNNSFNKSKLTINEVLMQGDNSLNKKLARTKVTDIKAAISLNKKFQFINELFNGKSTDYNYAILEVEKSGNYNQAVKLIQEKYATKFNWKIEDPCVEEFYEIVERRFL